MLHCAVLHYGDREWFMLVLLYVNFYHVTYNQKQRGGGCRTAVPGDDVRARVTNRVSWRIPLRKSQLYQMTSPPITALRNDLPTNHSSAK
jgi:hypothetical protein